MIASAFWYVTLWLSIPMLSFAGIVLGSWLAGTVILRTAQKITRFWRRMAERTGFVWGRRAEE